MPECGNCNFQGSSRYNKKNRDSEIYCLYDKKWYSQRYICSRYTKYNSAMASAQRLLFVSDIKKREEEKMQRGQDKIFHTKLSILNFLFTIIGGLLIAWLLYLWRVKK